MCFRSDLGMIVLRGNNQLAAKVYINNKSSACVFYFISFFMSVHSGVSALGHGGYIRSFLVSVTGTDL